jgi:1-acyl-sn-glycerol-3-phosphate acyltransferase
MNPILYLIYQFLKLLTKLFLRVYYPNAERINLHHLKYKGGSILVSNHPNTLVDPLNAACRVPKIVHFLANAGLFKTKFSNWFFNTFFCIPVERPEDTKGKPLNNKAAFAKSHAFLASGGCLFIAPEGGSEMEPRIRPFKTGTARIALGAEASADFQLGLRIMPVGLSYEHPERFRSHMTVNAGKPIMVKDYQAAYEENTIAAARLLTKDLEEQMRSLTIDLKDEAEEQVIVPLKKMLRNSHPLPTGEHFQRSKRLIEAYRTWAEKQPDARAAFDGQLQQYQSKLEQLKTSDKAVAKPPKALLLRLLAFILLLPVFLYGWLNSILPFATVRLISKKVDIFIGYQTTVRVLSGLLLFPIFWAIQTIIVAQLCPYALWYLLSLPFSAWFALRYWEEAAELLAQLRISSKTVRQPLQKQRETLMDHIERLLNDQN